MTKPPLLMNVYVGVNALFTRATVCVPLLVPDCTVQPFDVSAGL